MEFLAFAASEGERPSGHGVLMPTTEADLALHLLYLNKVWFVNKGTHLNKVLDSMVFFLVTLINKMQWAELHLAIVWWAELSGILLQLVNIVTFSILHGVGVVTCTWYSAQCSPIKNGANTLTDTSPRKINKWQIKMWKDVLYHMSSRKCKLK